MKTAATPAAKAPGTKLEAPEAVLEVEAPEPEEDWLADDDEVVLRVLAVLAVLEEALLLPVDEAEELPETKEAMLLAMVLVVTQLDCDGIE